jgi:exonuclease SbcC
MIIESISFRGFNTFKSPTEIDFASLGPGTFAITGDNGAGKTTLLEMPFGMFYHLFPSRKPSALHDYVDPKRGGDGHMYFSAGGKSYQATLTIPPKGAKVARLVRVDVDPEEELATGKVTVYKDVIERMFGPSQANLASVFGQQGGGGGFDAMEKADRKKLFRWYLGLDGVDKYHKEISDQLNAIDVAGIEREERRLAEANAEMEDLKERLHDARLDKKAAVKARKKAAKAYEEAIKGASLAKQAERYLIAEEAGEEADALIERLEEKLGETLELVDTDTSSMEERVESLQGLIDGADEANDACERAVGFYDEYKTAYEDALESTKLLGEVPCAEYDDCAACKFIVKATLAKTELPHLKGQVEKTKKQAKAAQKIARSAGKIAAATEEEIDGLDGRIRKMRKVEREQTGARVQWARDEERLASARKALEDAVEEIERSAEGLPFGDDDELELVGIPSTEDIEDAKQALEDADDELEGATKAKEQLAVRVGIAGDRVKNIEEALGKLHLSAKDMGPLKLLLRAVGPAGFPIYEIDAAGPDVSSTINDLLEACYGSRFAVAIRTLAPKKKGGFKEDFDFVIEDRRASASRSIGQISGGEKTIIGEAMRIGFALYQASKAPAPCRFQTMFRDEAEGSLSPTNARRYVRMLNRARDLGGFHQIFFVTHNDYAAASANGILRVKTGGTIEIKKGAV